jgi:hypothetical protein
MSVETQKPLSDTQQAEAWFDAHYRAHAPLEQYRQLQRDINQCDLTLDDRPLSASPKPFFLPRSDRSVLATGTAALNQILGRVATLLKQREDASRFLGFDRRQHAYLFSDSGYPGASPVVRYDTLYDVATRKLRFLEFNTHSPSSIGLHDRLIDCLEKVPVIGALKKRMPCRVDRLALGLANALIGSYERYCQRKGQPLCEHPLIVVMTSEKSSVKSDVVHIASLLTAMGMRCEFATPQQLVNTNGALSLDGEHVDILYRDAIHDFAVPLFGNRDKLRYCMQYIARCLVRRGPIKVRDFKSIFNDALYLKAGAVTDACRTGAVCLVNPLFSYILSSKIVLALLYEDRFHDQFSPEQHHAIEKYVPWTHVLNDVRVRYNGAVESLVDLVKANKDRFVIKPALGYGGRGVAIGCKTSRKAWHRYIVNALRTNRRAVVQDLVAIPTYRVPAGENGRPGEFREFNVNLNLWSFDGRFHGAFVRAAEGAVINLHAGGMLVPVFYVQSGTADSDNFERPGQPDSQEDSFK